MIFTYKELKEKYGRRQLESKLKKEELIKIEKGYYSDEKFYNHLELFIKKNPNVVFTSESAFFFWGLTDYIPEKEFVATERKAKPIKDASVVQIFSTEEYFEIGRTTTIHNDVVVNVYDKERMLIELARNKNTMSYDYYKEIIANYRAISDELDMSKLARYLKKFKNGDNIFETIHREVC